MRLNRYLASCGVGSRRGVEPLIKEGRVSIDGSVCTDLSRRVEEGEQVSVNGKPISTQPPSSILVNKPRHILTTRHDPEGRETIYDILPPRYRTLHHVGRLDRESEGLIILTNLGDLSSHLTHPTCGVQKTYAVTLDHAFDPQHTGELIRGIKIEGGLATAAAVKVISPRRLQIVLTQGLKRQIRLMMDALGYRVKRLVRTQIDTLDIADVPPGKWRPLRRDEITTLLAAGKPTQR